MQPGIVVRIRVNPTTCMSVLDTLAAVGIDTRNKSFATCVSAALNVLVETAKQSGVLPEPDPFEFNEKLRYHKGEEAPDRRKLPKSKAGTLNPLIFSEHTPDLGTPKWLPKTPSVVPEAPTAGSWDTKPSDPMELMEYNAAIQRLSWTSQDEIDWKRDQVLIYGA